MGERDLLRGSEVRHGVMRLEAATTAGLSRPTVGRKVASGQWDRLGRGVYGVVGAPRTWRRELLATVWSAGELALASHRSAGALWGLDGFDEGPFEVAVPTPVLRRVPGARVRRVRPLGDEDRTTVDGIPVTSIERTVVDLAAVCSMGALARALDSALLQRLTEPGRVSACLMRVGRRGRKGARVVATLIEERLGGLRPLESGLEHRVERVLVRAGLPRPVRQHEVHGDSGLIARVDLAYPRHRLAIEADGYRWHGGREAWQTDLRRRSRLAAAGWRVVHCTWNDLRHEPSSVADSVRQALQADV